jgi:hypothetical protein
VAKSKKLSSISMRGDAFKTKRDPSAADGTIRYANKGTNVTPSAQDDDQE